MKLTKQTVYLREIHHYDWLVKSHNDDLIGHVKESEGYFFTSEQLNEYTQKVIKEALNRYMNPEYIIINKTDIQKRIEELEKQLNTLGHTSQEEIHAQGYLSGKIQQLRETLSQSTPLIPEIEKAFQQGVLFCQSPLENINLKNHITNLKLDI